MMNNNIFCKEEKKTEIVTIMEMFSENNYFRIPDYQRGYAWRNEFAELWKDIIRLYRNNNVELKHYTGMLTLDEIKDYTLLSGESLKGKTAFYIVDGQQRLTSIVIIIQSLLEVLKAEYENECDLTKYNNLLECDYEFRFGYSNDRKDGAAEYFRERIFKSNTPSVQMNQYLSNIDYAKTFMEKELKKYNCATINELLELVLNRLVFNIYFVTKDFDVRVTFDTMNNRGKKLSKLELLKNRLMYLTTFFPGDDNYSNRLKNGINETWKKIYSDLALPNVYLSDDEYLRAHWIVYERLEKNKGDAYIKDILENKFASDYGEFYNFIQEQNFNKAYELINNYIISLREFSSYWCTINCPLAPKTNLSTEELDWIKRLSRLGNLFYLKASLMVLISKKTIPYTEKNKFYSLIERFVFINRLIGQNTNNDLSFLISSVRELRKSNQNEEISKIREMCKSIQNHQDAITKKRIEEAINTFGNYINKKTNYYYSWKGLKYFLYEYNTSLKADSSANIEWYDLNEVSIEHIFPQSPNTEYWNLAFKDYESLEEKTQIANSLGNLLLLSNSSENSTLQNYSFPVKKNCSVDNGKFSYNSSSRSAQKVAENKCWTPKEVYERSKELLSFMYREWFQVEGINEATWEKWIDECNLIPFDYSKFDETQYQTLSLALEEIDTSNERKAAENNKQIKYDLEKDILEYFDSNIFNITYNTSKVSYLNDKFTFKITKSNDKPITFECGISIEKEKIKIEYDYNKNNIKVWNEKNYRYYENPDSVEEKIRKFLESFYRYIRKSQNQNRPYWICE